MSFRFLFIVSFICFVGYSQQKDTIHFYNNSIMVGELNGMSLGKINFDSDEVGDVRIKYHKIKTIKAKSHYYRIETNEKKIYFGYIEFSKIPGNIILIAGTTNYELRIIDITSLSIYGKNWKESFSGYIGLGYSYTKSSAIGRLNFDGLLKYFKKKYESRLEASTIVTSENGTINRERENLGLSANYLINSKWFTGVSLRYERNSELGLLSRIQEGIGVGYNLISKQHNISHVTTGIVLNQEDDFNNNKNEYVEWATKIKYDFFSFSKPNITLGVSQTLFVSLSQKGRIRNDGEFKVNWELIDDFKLSLSMYHNFDKKSPTNNSNKFDYGFVTGLNYEF